jgi:hypothetical protein
VVLGGPAELDELLLDLAAGPGQELPQVVRPLDAEQFADLLGPGHLAQHRAVGAAQQQLVAVALDDDAAVARDGLGDVDADALRHRELAVLLERAEHVVGAVPGRPCVPQPEPGDAVGVHVLGGALELGEDAEVVPRVLRLLVGDLEEDGAIALHDQGSGHEGRV